MSRGCTSATVARWSVVVIGMIAMGLGLHSHFNSYWLIGDSRFTLNNGTTYVDKMYRFCNNVARKDFITPLQDQTCPDMAMERFFVAMIIIFTILSTLNLIVAKYLDRFRCVELLYHMLAAVLLVIAGVLYIVSAEQAQGVMETLFGRLEIFHLYREEKIAAGSFAIISAFMHLVTGIIVGLEREVDDEYYVKH